MNWPVLYINKATREPLRVITREDWFGGLAARYSLSHVSPGNHFFVDSSGCVFQLAGKGFLSPGFQILEPEPVEQPEIRELVLVRARSWPGIAAQSIAQIIAACRATAWPG